MFKLRLRPIVIGNGVAVYHVHNKFREQHAVNSLQYSFIMGVDVETINPGDGELCYCIPVNCLLRSFSRLPKLGSPGGKLVGTFC